MAPATPAPTSLVIHIDDESFTVTDKDQEAASLLRLAGRDPKLYDLFLIKRDGVEDRIRDNQIIDLKDGDRFVARQRIHFLIDGEPFETYDNVQTAAALLRLAKVDPAGYDLARVLPDGKTQKFSGEELVTLHEGDDFVTAKRAGGVA